MPKPVITSVDDFLQQLDLPLRAVVEALRLSILAAAPTVAEQIKWNSPSFYYTGPMAPFEAREYRRDIVVLNLHRGHPLLVFPTGAGISDATGLLEGSYTDGRRLIQIRDLAEAQAKAAGLQQVVRAWLALVEPA
ncbi:DUF1801 domain-containing protein [Hymenobacter lucidus]|uniref:DUF1801 domain-containing protein n=1 Tax=Hymenobacter lucidus TaxID=2880930 RepID=A0ABS8ALD3_9BACT|nr:DUF1801 domain-containing protein [Hymenobacter lucidus]MCB2406858.1 DUF1801 domain-containing protein [Hymenobacter lucidus]